MPGSSANLNVAYTPIQAKPVGKQKNIHPAARIPQPIKKAGKLFAPVSVTSPIVRGGT